jgi:hypothetical protein
MQTALKCSKFILWLNTEEFAEMLSNEKKLDNKISTQHIQSWGAKCTPTSVKKVD